MKKGRLVVVSNRLPTLKAGWKTGMVPSSGGLVSSLLPVMEDTRKGVWMGWSGKSKPAKNTEAIKQIEHDVVSLVGVNLPASEIESYYNGFCNRTLWPLFHSFQAQLKLDKYEQEAYFNVSRKFAEALVKILEPNDVVWVHDYHLAPLGRFLREAGFNGPAGFFLHIPFPPVEMIEIIPDPLGFMDAWLHYDLVGFHTDGYVENYFEVMARLMLGVREAGRLLAGSRKQRVITCPIGIDPMIYNPENDSKASKSLKTILSDAKIVLGLDRLDYTKGIPERLLAFEYFLKNYPSWQRAASLIQICAPSRAGLKGYVDQKALVDELVGRINSEFAEHDWTPIRYLYRAYVQAELAHFFRDADVGLVTPLRDGMNLVASEFVAAQRPEDPGVLVLSKFTGAAEYLHEAVIVNPYLPDSVAEGLDRALSMSMPERIDRHHAMLEHVKKNTAVNWAKSFLENLAKAHKENR